MNTLHVFVAKTKKWKGATLAVFAFQEEKPRLLGLGKDTAVLERLAIEDGFKGRERESVLIRPAGENPAERLLLIGLGKPADFSLEVLRRCAPRVLREAERLSLTSMTLVAPEIGTVSTAAEEFQALAEGLFLGAYRYDKHRKTSIEKSKRVEDVHLTTTSTAVAQEAVERARIFSQATLLARDLINEPPSRMNPERLAAEALKLRKTPLSVKVFEKKELEKMGMEAILGVGVGGLVPPRLVEIVYRPSGKAKKTIALVGKGITFDSGGLSLKPAQSMETMKDDMSGAAAVIGVMSALPALKFPIEVHGYLAIAENMPGGRAQKPGDVVKAFNGKTIEILNTDAEGRLVLADALSYACSKKPDVVIDIATLTGACVVALGHRIAAILSPEKELVAELLKASTKSGEKFWELPLEAEYAQDIKSKIADLKNIGSRRGEAGTIIGGLFLKEFVEGTRWAHLDIAGPSWTDSDQPYCPTGGTGNPVRTLLHYLESVS